MAFNFNWSPLIADTDRVRDMLTSSLNKSPKPPIIVDDIIVNELNLGTTPPELEILEIGDLAEDKFRGIFKMSYTGDAYLTLKTKVQANPLKTFLSSKKNNFASPTPLAAGSGLVIPLQITLSEIRLSGFVILVFSKQKGITLVFRNDPIESLKVSSTFDSIPFVRDYLQRTIESQLRVLFMEDLPAIIHRLSLKMFNADYQIEDDSKSTSDVRRPIDPFATPSQRPMNGSSLGLDDFSLDTPTETYASFSQKNLLRLAALSESQRTLSLFTPALRDTVYRAWASASDSNAGPSGIATPAHRATTLSRIQSTLGSPSGMSSAASQASDSASQATRPSLVSMQSMQSQSTVYSFTTGRPRPRKRKHRVVNLRKNSKADANEISDTVSLSSGYTESASHSAGQSGSGSAAISVAQTDPTSRTDSRYLREGEIETPPRSPEKRREARKAGSDSRLGVEDTVKKRSTPGHRPRMYDVDATPRASMYISKDDDKAELPRMRSIPDSISPPAQFSRTASELNLFGSSNASSTDQQFTGGILSQAWMMKGAAEIAKRVEEEKARRARNASDPDAPPAYVR